MKINPFAPSGAQVLSESDGSARVNQQQGRFMAELSHTQGSMSRQQLDMLLDKINDQGQKLKQTPTYAELKAYRKLISQFMNEAVGRMYTVNAQAGWDRHGRKKMYTTIKQIDVELSSLTEEIRQDQTKELGIAARLDTIRGLLVDLYT